MQNELTIESRWRFRYCLPMGRATLEADRTELHDLAGQHPDRVADMLAQYDAWAKRCGVIPRERIDALLKDQNVGTAFWEREDFKAPYLP